MDARSLAALNLTAASPPKLLNRSTAAFEGAAVTLYLFRIPGRRDLCLTLSKPLGDVVTDLDVSAALYYVRFDEDPSSSRMTLLRRNPATETSAEVALIVESASHIDVFAGNYRHIEETFWRMNGNETLTVKSNFGCTVHHSDSSYYFLSPWTGRCTFLPVKSGHALRCSHTLQFPFEESVDISELRFNFAGHKIKAKRDPHVAPHSQQASSSSNRVSEETTASVFSSSRSSHPHHPSGLDNSSKRRSIFSRSSDHTTGSNQEVPSSKRKSFLLPIQKRLHVRSSTGAGSSASNAVGLPASVPLDRSHGAAVTNPRSFPGLQASHDSSHIVTDSHSSNSASEKPHVKSSFSEPMVDEGVAEVAPNLPPRPAVGRVPMFPHDNRPGEPMSGLGISLDATGKASKAPDAARRPLQSVSEDSSLGSNVLAHGTVDPPRTGSLIKRKPVGSSAQSEASNQSASRALQTLTTRGFEDTSCVENRSAEQPLDQGDEPGTSLEQQGPYESVNTIQPPRVLRQLDVHMPPQHEEAAETDFRDQPQAPYQQEGQIATEDEEEGVDQQKSTSGSPSEVSSKLDLSLGQEKLGGGSDGEQAKLGKLIVWSEGQKMLDLIVSANVMMFYRTYQAANMPRKEA